MKRFTFIFTVLYILFFISSLDSIADMSALVAVAMGFGAICLVAVCATQMTENDFMEYTGWNSLKRWANS